MKPLAERKRDFHVSYLQREIDYSMELARKERRYLHELSELGDDATEFDIDWTALGQERLQRYVRNAREDNRELVQLMHS